MPEIADKYVPFLRAQLRKITSMAEGDTIPLERVAQDSMGAIMQRTVRDTVMCQDTAFEGFRAAMLCPEKPESSGVAMYVHGGGYCCGDLEYAKGFGKVLASEADMRVFCPAYRLAPEYPFPAALNDVMTCYRYLLKVFPPEKIVLTGESAGGGLIYCMCLKMKEEGLPLPGGLVAMSPWADLTASGKSYEENNGVDPSMTPSRLKRFGECYTRTPSHPLVSPMFGDLKGLPESLIFVGGDEVMRDDAVGLHKALISAGCKSELTIAPEMWHGYVLYCLKERRADMDKICEFVRMITA